LEDAVVLLLIERVGLVWLAVRMLAGDPFGVFSGLECWRAGCLEIGLLWIVRMASFFCVRGLGIRSDCACSLLYACRLLGRGEFGFVD
jgi:hypothetical protein